MDEGLEVAVGNISSSRSPSFGVKQILLLVPYVCETTKIVLIYTCEALGAVVLKHFQAIPVE